MSNLKGRSNYDTWATDVENVLRRQGMAYVLESYAPLDNVHQQYDDWVARKIIYYHISAARAHRLRRLEYWPRTAYRLWSLLRSDVLCCPCNGLKGVATNRLKEVAAHRLEELLKYQESAEDGCASCKLILDAVEAYAPGWISLSEFSRKRRWISAQVSSYLCSSNAKGRSPPSASFRILLATW
jgi:hypothetical protein